MDVLSAPLPIPVSTTAEIPGRTVTGYAGAAFGLIARSTGFSKGFKGEVRRGQELPDAKDPGSGSAEQLQGAGGRLRHPSCSVGK